MSNPDDDPAFDVDPDEDLAAYEEWAANQLARRLINRNAISPMGALPSTQSPRA
jgi:hypothetical protein